MSDISKAILKAIDNPYATLASDGLMVDKGTLVDTGCYALNAVISGSIFGGVPTNKTLGLAGEQATGKTFFTLAICKHFQDTHPDAHVVYFESEGAIDTKILKSRGIDLSRFVSVPVKTCEQFKTEALRISEIMTEKKIPSFFVLDSLGNLSTKKELGDSKEGKDTRDMTRTQILKAAFRVLQLELSYQNIPLVCTNHIYQVIGSYIPTKDMGGGSGLKYAASVILFLTKSQAKAKDAGGTSSETDRIGSFINVTAQKSRLVIEGTKVKVLLRHNGGLDKYFGLFDIAKDAGLVVKDGKRWCNTLTGELYFAKDILSLTGAPKFYDQAMLEAIDEYVQKTFQYGDIESADFDVDEFDNVVGEDE